MCPLQRQQHRKAKPEQGTHPGSRTRHPTQDARSAGWLVLVPLRAKSWHGTETGDTKGTVCWAGIAQPVDPTGQCSPVDLGAISGFAQRPPPAVHELRALALSMQEHLHGDLLPPANPPARGTGLGHSQQLSMKSKRHKKTWQNVCFSFIKSAHTDLQVTDPSTWRKLLPCSLRTTTATMRGGRNNTPASPLHLLKQPWTGEGGNVCCNLCNNLSGL